MGKEDLRRTVIIVGGTGFIGQKVGQALAREGYSLVVTTRDPSAWTEQMSFPCKLVAWDPRDQEFPLDLHQKPAAIINLAGAGIGDQRWTAAYRQIMRESRILTTRKIAEKLAPVNESSNSQQPIRFIQASAVGFYGSRGDEILTEESPRGSGFLADLCYEWESEALKAHGKASTVTILRIGVVLGWGGGFLNTMSPLYLRGIGATIGSGKQWIPWIHIDDVAEMLKQAATGSFGPGIFNGTAPEPVTLGEMHRELKRFYGTQVSPPVPAFALKGILGQQSEIALGSTRALPKKILAAHETLSKKADKRETAAGKPESFEFSYPTLKDAFQQLFTDDYDRASCHLVSYQWVPYSREEIWPFFTDETNLERLTPPWLHFTVSGKTTSKIEKGTLIEYKLKLHGLPMKWKSQIREWEPTTHFVDHQLQGPYSLWDHVHRFEDLAGGTLMTDHVRFRLPLGKLGFVFASPFVLGDLSKIFSYRRKQIASLFPARNGK